VVYMKFWTPPLLCMHLYVSMLLLKELFKQTNLTVYFVQSAIPKHIKGFQILYNVV